MSSDARRAGEELRSLRRGSLIVLSAPSGTGKSTIVHRLVAEVSDLSFSVSATTREPRDGEVDGVHYHFLDQPTFARRVAEGEFLEHAEVHGNHYGTLRSATEEQLAAGRDLLLDIDVQGARQVAASGFPAHLVFLLPPSRDELERRLRRRASESEDVLRDRLAAARDELAGVDVFGYCVLNDDLDAAVEAIKTVLLSRRYTRLAMAPVIARVAGSFRVRSGSDRTA